MPARDPADEDDNRSVRVFLSSTFLDMQIERDELVTKAFPALRAKYRARGVEVFEVDLRWGITRQQQERGETLATLLAEIDRCRPYFVGLLGDRYGWVPPAAALTDKLKADYPAIAETKGASVTAMEIMHGVLSNPDTAARAFFFERDPSWDWIATLNEGDRAAAAAETDAAGKKLSDLKQSLIGRKVLIEPYARPDDIRQKVQDALDALLAVRFPEADAPDAFEQNARLHRAYARERRVLHVGADSYVRDLDCWMQTPDAPPTLIIGTSGGGKSTLVANWVHSWRRAHSNDIVFEHYLGASPDSADPMLLMRRLWEHVNRATSETVTLPDGNADLMTVSAELAQRLAQTRAALAREGRGLVVALDGLDKLSSEQNLRWLPLLPGVHVLASSLDGEAKSAALARGFASLEVKPLAERECKDLIKGTLARWGRSLDPQNVDRILKPAAEELAGSPLYLKTVLDELRVSADHARLAERLEVYRRSADMPDLFDRVLARLEEDCEPGLVGRTLPLIWASRAGLEEAEIIAISGATRLAWAILRNGLNDSLRDQAGRVAFSHDYLREAVETRYFKTDWAKRAARGLKADWVKRAVHLSIADRFSSRAPDARQVEELPYQLQEAEAWDRLEALLVDFDRFELLRERGDIELMSYWLPLKKRGCSLEALLCKAFEARAGDGEFWTESDIELAFHVASFLEFAGASGIARLQLEKWLSDACERLLGPEHPTTIASLNNLAGLLRDTNRHAEAEPLSRRVLAMDEKEFGPDHTNVATSLNNLAGLLAATNRHAEAEPHFRRALVIDEASLGPDHPSVARDLNSLAGLLANTKRQREAEPLFRRALAIDEKNGPDHPNVAIRLNNLACLLAATNRHAEAEPLSRRALAIDEKSLGPDHPRVATRLNNLAELLCATNRHAEAEPLYRRALTMDEASFHHDHPNVAIRLNNLALLLVATNRRAEAEPLFLRALPIDEKSFGPDHPKVAILLNNLAELLVVSKRYAEAEPLARRALRIMETSFGSDHPNTRTVAKGHQIVLAIVQSQNGR